MTHRGHFPFFLIILLAAQPLFAQSQDDRVQQLEKKLDELVRQAGELRAEINQLKGGQATPVPQPEAEDLTKVTEVPSPAAEQAPAAAPQLTDVQTVNNQANPGASKVFNPDTSVIGNFIGRAGKANPYEFGPDHQRAPMTLDEAEVAFEAFVDPYMKGKFFLSITPEGIDVEEGYVNLLTLPYDLTAKIGKMKAMFGKDNTWHTHVRPWVDQPLVVHNFFGDEGLNDRGVSISKSFPNDVAFVEATAEAFSGDVPDVFARHNNNDLFYNGHLKMFKDISENSNIELGTSYARGNASGDAAVQNQFAGVDVTYRWKPLQQGNYRGFIGRFEGIVDDRDDISRRLKGFYASGDYQLGQRWFTGVRLDRADRGNVTDKGVSATLTFWPSEFSQFRSQLRRTSYGGAKSITELLFGMQFSIGAHGAHSF
jgi:hypothetical protein